jgi:hypothetical protein
MISRSDDVQYPGYAVQLGLSGRRVLQFASFRMYISEAVNKLKKDRKDSNECDMCQSGGESKIDRRITENAVVW